MSVFMDFLLTIFLPFVISLMTAAVDKYLRPYTTQEGFDAIAALFQKFYNEAVEKGWENVMKFIVTIIAPVFKITIVEPVPTPPEVVSAQASELLKDVVKEMDLQGIKFPKFPEYGEDEDPWADEQDGGG
jgi:hypothetical protein